MNRKNSYLVLVLLFLVSLFAGCAGGGSSSAPTPATSDTVSDKGGGSGTFALAWAGPTTNTDGSPLTDLAGYKVHYGTVSGSYANTVDVGTASACSVNSLSPGTYYISVTAYNKEGAESGYSNEVTKTIL